MQAAYEDKCNEVYERDTYIKNLMALIRKEIKPIHKMKYHKHMKFARIWEYCKEIEEKISDDQLCESLLDE